jgi:crotonobetainyl-CoA:carnitine CoA-transferase CaiB-like acyl-CoA transferase
VAAAQVRDPIAARDDPHLAARGLLQPLFHPDAGAHASGFLGPRLPINFAGRAPQLAPAEQLGVSTDAVLGELGLSAAELADLRDRKVIA